MNKSLAGLHAGLIATGPMTISMVMMQEHLHDDEKSPFPPATISHDILTKLNFTSISQNRQSVVATLAHLQYGAAAGLFYSNTAGSAKNMHPIVKGIGFGCAFWTLNYFGALPALGVRANGFKMTPKRNAMMLASHVVWGACLGYLEDTFKTEGYDELSGENKAPQAE